jgi:hypothetical protein
LRLEDVFDAREEQRRLARILMPRFLRLLQAWHEMVMSVFQLSPEEFRLDDPATRKQLAHAAERVVLIDQGTRAALREVLREGQKRGYSTHEIAHGVPADGYGGVDGLYLNTWRGRSETIARNEVAEAQWQAGMDRLAATGQVTHIEIVESEDTDEPCASRNGKVVPLTSHPQRLHVNCRASFIPVVNETAA